MTEVLIIDHDSNGPEPTFNAAEFSFPNVEFKDLETGMGRYGIFTALIAHQEERGLDPADQVWAGINGRSLFTKRTLFSDLNPQADPEKFTQNFYATQLGHWREVIGEVQYSPFTYIHKGLLSGSTPYPTLVGFDRNKITADHPRDTENVNWRPGHDETVETALKSIYYFPGLFQD